MELDEKKMLVAIAQLDPDKHVKDLLMGIAKQFRIPVPYTAKLCEKLRLAGLVAFSNKRGYALTREGWKKFKELQDERPSNRSNDRSSKPGSSDKRIII